MPLNWIDVTPLSFNTLLLLERVQLSWLPGWAPEKELAIAFQANPTVEWFLRYKCPEIAPWVDQVIAQAPPAGSLSPEQVRQAEIQVLGALEDLVVYAVDPAIYDAQPFLAWDDRELTSLVDFSGKIVLDIGAGTGRLTFTAAPLARAVFAVEPVGNLRSFIKAKTRRLGYSHVYSVDGLITDLPFPEGFADVVLSGHVFGDDPPGEYAELKRVTRPGGMVILCPGTSITQEPAHLYLLEQNFQWGWLPEPGGPPTRKYWKTQ
jgi:SAM-dependent methyltransferase